MWTTIVFTEKLSADFISTELTYMYSVVRHYSNSFTGSCYSLNWFDTTELRSMNLYAKPYKTPVLCTWVYKALLGLLTPINKEV